MTGSNSLTDHVVFVYMRFNGFQRSGGICDWNVLIGGGYIMRQGDHNAPPFSLVHNVQGVHNVHPFSLVHSGFVTFDLFLL